MSEQLYVRRKSYSNSEDEVMDDDDVWDDSLLIKAYNKAVNMAKEKIAKKISLENGEGTPNDNEATSQHSPPKARNNKTKSSSPKVSIKLEGPVEWKEGMPCRCIFTEDGVEYEGTIKSMFPWKGTCVVVYLGYGNEEEVEIAALKPSNGEKARKAQESRSTKMNYEADGFFNQEPSPYSGEDLGVIPPPPPPNVMAHFPKDEADALSAMLMAWYMSGYHTGYYQGLTRSKAQYSHGSRPATSRLN